MASPSVAIPQLELPRSTGGAEFTSSVLPTNPNYVEGIPPDRGQAALRQIADVESVTIPLFLRASDIRNDEVIFYEVTAMSFSHVWTVYKRFSDFDEFHHVCKKQLCVEHDDFLKLPDLPSKFQSKSDGGLDQRRLQLIEYLNTFLRRARETEARVRMDSYAEGGTSRARAEGRLAALTQHFVSFLRQNSPLYLMVETHQTPILEPPPPLQSHRAFHPPKEGDDIPPVRITRYGNAAFVATLHVPGVASKDLYVCMNADVPRHIIVGGRWNNYVAASAITQKIDDLTRGARTRSRDGTTDGLDPAEIYFDTLPVGDFEVTFEVPEPFVVATWFTEMKDSVFHVVWSTVL